MSCRSLTLCILILYVNERTIYEVVSDLHASTDMALKSLTSLL